MKLLVTAIVLDALAALFIIGPTLWALVASATNHGYPPDGVLVTVGFVGMVLALVSIGAWVAHHDYERNDD